MDTKNFECRMLTGPEFPAWDHFVSEHPEASIYHFSVWRHILKAAFNKEWSVLGLIADGKVFGGIPLVHMKSKIFGNSLVSMPYVNYGGVVFHQEAHLEKINGELKCLAKKLEVEYVEMRHLQNYDLGLPVRTEKVSMWLTLPSTAEELFKSFKPKLRSQVRKGEKNQLVAKVGGLELVKEFYAVFSENMRDLGTPVYTKDIFTLILEAFPKTARIIVIFNKEGKALAGGFLLGYRGRLEIPWASSLRAFNYLQTNMFLYWNCLKYACSEGYEIFDFGRSTKGASTYKFKEQWGAQPIPHYWHYWINNGEVIPQINPTNPKYRLAISVWQRLPLLGTQILGPYISKHLP